MVVVTRCFKWLVHGIPMRAVAVGFLLFCICTVLGVWVWVVNAQTRDLATKANTLAEQNRVLGRANHKLALQGKNAQLALCSFQDDLNERIKKSRDDLKKSHQFDHNNPNGGFGFSHAQIKVAIRNQELLLSNQLKTYKSIEPYIDCTG